MNRQHLLTLILLTFTTSALATDIKPGAPQDKPILLFGGDVYTASGDVIQNGQVLFENGKITAVGRDLPSTTNATRIDCTGKRVYPGLIDSNSELGLIEIDAVRATRDPNETGTINPNARAEVAINPDSELFPVARANGVLLALTAPGGGTIVGTSALIQLDGWTWEDMTVRAPVAMHVVWPRMTAPPRGTGGFGRRGELERSQRRDEVLQQLKQSFDDARAYLSAKSAAAAHDFDARWEAMIPLLEARIPMMVRANDAQQIQSAIAFAQKQKVKLIIVGGLDAPRCADLLKRYDVPVILDGVQRLPARRGDAYDDAFTVPARLKEAGVRFCVAADRRASMARNLPYHAATAAAFGLSHEDALRSITLWPAQILGVSDRVGSIEPGRDATLFVCDGDILETPTRVERAFIQGRQIDLSSKHTKLWEKYREKYKRLGLTNGGAAAGAGR
jgi:imidazolonepropionase-like amidohydrolase